MTTEMSVTVFTDLKDSTRLQAELGTIYSEFLKEHLRVGRLLFDRNSAQVGDEYKKNIGDAHMAVFRSIESAVNYAVQMQQYHRHVPGLNRLQVGLRIGLGLGILSQEQGDAFGFGVNEAARVEAAANPGEVIMNEKMVDALRTSMPRNEIEEYLINEQEVDQKGIGRRKLYWFDWDKFGRNKPDRGLAGLVFQHLRSANVELSNISIQHLAEPSLIIWPVVPRNLATAIHRGQAEIVRLLALLGWRLVVLISDCGSSGNFPRAYCMKFQRLLGAHLASRGVIVDRWLYLSDLYEPSSPDYSELQLRFRKLSEHFTLDDLIRVKEKGLSRNVRQSLRNESTLVSLVPILTSAAVLYLAESSGQQRQIVLAGGDETYQWTHTLRVKGEPHASELMGIIFNPVLEEKLAEGRVQQRHASDWPTWYSQEQLQSSFRNTNLGWWLFQLHCYLPEFPATYVEIKGFEIRPNTWADRFQTPDILDERAFIERVWPILDTST